MGSPLELCVLAPPTVRRLQLDFSSVPRDWFMDDPVLTSHANGLHLVFPEGERFFIRSVRAFAHCVTDPALRARVKGFIGQEAVHGREHEASFRMLEVHGLELQSWMGWYVRWAYGFLERIAPARLCLSITIALEHLTATLGENALTQNLLDEAHPTMARLLRWHAAEEIEHKSVAFDVYRAAGGGWLLRVWGMVMALALLLFFWSSAVRHLRRQDPRITRAAIAATHRRLSGVVNRSEVLGRAFLEYARPGFHPDQRDNLHLASAWLAGAGLAGIDTDPSVAS